MNYGTKLVYLYHPKVLKSVGQTLNNLVMAKFNIVAYKSNQKRDGSYPICLRATKEGKRKYIDLGLTTQENQWDESTGRFKRDKRLNPTYVRDNSLLNHYEERKDSILRKFAEERIDWTLNLFEEQFLGMSKQGKVYDFFITQIENLKATNHIGNAKAYARTLHVMGKYDDKIEERLFPEIDIKYVNAFNVALEKDKCSGNTRKYYMKTLRAVLNKAIKEKEASLSTYPFGKGGFEISTLEEETRKRYLLSEDLNLIKNSPQKNFTMEYTRRLFLFSYYCFGISYVDMASLTNHNIEKLETGEYIVYKRQKIKNQKGVKSIKIPLTDTIRELIEWFGKNTPLIGDYLTPIITRDYSGEQLYEHIRSRYGRYNKNLKKLGVALGIERQKLTTYVSRHTMAMTLQSNKVPREVISQVMGHSNLETTNVYLDSFETSVVDEAAKLL